MGGELSVFIDESGDIGSGSEYYIVALVFHDQRDPIDMLVDDLGRASGLTTAGEVPFHFTPVLRGHRPFDTIEPAGRKAFFNAFAYFVNKAPFSYEVFPYLKREIRDGVHLRERLERDIQLRYASSKTGASEEKFFGSRNLFRRNYLKKLRRKRL